MEPSWDQMPPKPDPKNNQKNDHFLGGLRIDLGGIFAPKWGGPGGSVGGPSGDFFGSWGCLGAKMRPRRPKRPQEAPKTASKTDFGTILVDVWVDFLMVFWLVWRFISALVVCCGVGLLPCWFVGLLACCLVYRLVGWFSCSWRFIAGPGAGWPKAIGYPAPLA